MATGLAPNVVHIGRLARLPLTVFERSGVAGHQSLARLPGLLRFGYKPIAMSERYCSQTPCPHSFPRIPPKPAIADALRPVPKFALGCWAWMYNLASTTRRGVNANTNAKVLKAKLAFNWTALTTSYQLVPDPPSAPRMASHLAITRSIGISLPTFTVRTLASV